MEESSNLDGEAMARLHNSRFIVFLVMDCEDITLNKRVYDLLWWRIQGRVWKCVPIPCPVN